MLYLEDYLESMCDILYFIEQYSFERNWKLNKVVSIRFNVLVAWVSNILFQMLCLTFSIYKYINFENILRCT